MMFLVRQTDEHCRKHCEHVCLYEGDKELKAVQEQQHDDAQRAESACKPSAHRTSEEDDACETQHDGMSRHHVGKETDHEREWFGEHTEELNHRHYGHGVRL